MNSSSSVVAIVTRARPHLWRSVCTGVLLMAALTSRADAETTAELDDAAARLQYAFYTGDAHALERVLLLIEGFESGGGLAAAKSYQLAYGHWKLAQLFLDPSAEERPGSTAKSPAAKSVQACIRHARAAIAQNATARNAGMAEAYAIEAACDGLSSSSRAMGPWPAACARNRSLRTAMSLAPDNPRVQLVDVLCARNAADIDPAPSDQLRAVVASFEAAPPAGSGEADWGHVEALTLLGASYLKRGDSLAARDALERALVLAPDYRLAQKLLQTAATRPQ